MKKNLKVALASKVPSIRASLVILGVAMAPGFAMAAGDDVDTGAIVAKITSMGTAAGVIGLAYLTVVLGVKAFKLLRSAA